MPDTYISLTRENFRTYHQILLEAALAEFDTDNGAVTSKVSHAERVSNVYSN
jgi:hypothetical protein